MRPAPAPDGSPVPPWQPRVSCLFPQLGPSAQSPSRLAGDGGAEGGPGLAPPTRTHSEPALQRRGDPGGGGSVLSAVTTTFGGIIGPPTGVREPSIVSAMEPAAEPSAAGGAAPPLAPRLSRAPSGKFHDAPYAMSCVSSVGSTWNMHYYKEPGLAFSRGLLHRDPRFSTECSPGVCCLKELELPALPRAGTDQRARNIEHVTNALRDMGASPPKSAHGSDVSMSSNARDLQRRGLPCAAVARSRYRAFMYQKTSC
mmetsp:Transcript_17334/g.49307  ORF Transcript_17334/g.49307 Transcript_17334/m.49307 type:complete len:256 (+) Transcript_17334:48-815(+)